MKFWSSTLVTIITFLQANIFQFSYISANFLNAPPRHIRFYILCGALNRFRAMVSPNVASTITLIGHTTLGGTPLDEWLSRRTDLYLTRHNTQKRKTSTLLAGFETAIPVSERPQTYDLDIAATGIGPFAFANMTPQMFNCLTKLNSLSRTTPTCSSSIL